MSRFERQKEARQRDAEQGLVTRVLRLRLKDRHAPYLRGLAAQVNLVCLGKVMQAGLALAGFSSLQEYRGVCARACGQDSSVLSKVLYAHTKVRTTRLQREKLGKAIENWEAAHRAEVFAAEQWRELATFLREDMPALPSLSASGLA